MVTQAQLDTTDERDGFTLSPPAVGGLTASFALGLACFGFLDAARDNAALQWSFIGPGVLLLAWTGVLVGRAQRTGRVLGVRVALRPQHYVQALAQGVFLLYWGWHWRPVYDSAFLIASQLVFAYAFDMLLCWSRRDTYTLGFGPVPVIFSINLFLWFADDWFYLQFLLVAVGFAVKELIRWEKAGRQVHIFNPSSFPLAIVSLALILTGTSDVTWGQDIATTQFFPPHVYLVLFLVGLPGQYLFGVTLMTMSAVTVTYLFGLLYFAATGVYFFYDSYIPIAVFLGMHLLFTDPSTAPRTEMGRILFGALYGLSTVALYAILTRAGVPPFYDKLLQVPLLNLSIQWLDRFASGRWLGRLASARWLRVVGPAPGRSLAPRQRNLAYMTLWAALFAVMTAANAVGDHHPGQWVPFWQAACADERPSACSYLADMHLRSCRTGSGWACNEAGTLEAVVSPTGEVRRWLELTDAADVLERGCALGFEAACRNLSLLRVGRGPAEHPPPTLDDYPILLRGTKGPLVDRSAEALFARACRQGWADTCGRSENGALGSDDSRDFD